MQFTKYDKITRLSVQLINKTLILQLCLNAKRALWPVFHELALTFRSLFGNTKSLEDARNYLYRKKQTGLSYKYTIGDDFEEVKQDFAPSYFARDLGVESKAYIEDIGSVQALLGSVIVFYAHWVP